MFCAANVFIYSLPAHWMWSNNGWLRQLGAVDVAGSSVVHALGGVSGQSLGPDQCQIAHRRHVISDQDPVQEVLNVCFFPLILHGAGLVASYVLGPRVAVHRQRERILLGSAQTSLIGLFMIWWAFLAFNSARCDPLIE